MKKTAWKPKKRIVVYTAIFGGTDDLKDPPFVDEDVDYVCFTDDAALTSSIFTVKLVPGFYRDTARSARAFKILPHVFLEGYRYSLWIDASGQLKGFSVADLIEKHLARHDLATFSHRERDCIYDEAEACISLYKDDPVKIRRQIRAYRAQGYPRHNGLIEGGFILRRHNSPAMIKLGNDWWREIVNHSRRDQISFSYVAWKNGFAYAVIDGIVWDNPYVRIAGHRKDVGELPDERRAERSRLEADLKNALRQLDARDTELKRLRADLARITGSRTWRAARKARRALRAVGTFLGVPLDN